MIFDALYLNDKPLFGVDVVSRKESIVDVI